MLTINLTNIDIPMFELDTERVETELKRRRYNINCNRSDDGTYQLVDAEHQVHVISSIRSIVAAQTSDRLLIESIGWLRHAKVISTGKEILAWASYATDSVPNNLIHFNLPVRKYKVSEMNDLDWVTRIYGTESRMRVPTGLHFPRQTAISLAKHYSWLFEEEFKVERIYNSRYEGMSFRDGQMCENRGATLHDDYMTSLEHIQFN